MHISNRVVLANTLLAVSSWPALVQARPEADPPSIIFVASAGYGDRYFTGTRVEWVGTPGSEHGFDLGDRVASAGFSANRAVINSHAHGAIDGPGRFGAVVGVQVLAYARQDHGQSVFIRYVARDDLSANWIASQAPWPSCPDHAWAGTLFSSVQADRNRPNPALQTETWRTEVVPSNGYPAYREFLGHIYRRVDVGRSSPFAVDADARVGWNEGGWPCYTYRVTANASASLEVEIQGRVVGCGYVDCDPANGPGTLDIFDFLCFQNEFDAGTFYACGCDTSSGPAVCDIFDVLCFQNAFAAGCP